MGLFVRLGFSIQTTYTLGVTHTCFLLTLHFLNKALPAFNVWSGASLINTSTADVDFVCYHHYMDENTWRMKNLFSKIGCHLALPVVILVCRCSTTYRASRLLELADVHDLSPFYIFQKYFWLGRWIGWWLWHPLERVFKLCLGVAGVCRTVRLRATAKLMQLDAQ